MRHALEPDHDLVGEDVPQRDLVLGAPALLGIFFAVVLVCAVCFGFGYSSSHGVHFSGESSTVGTPAHPAVQTAAPVAKPSPGVETPEEQAEAAPVQSIAAPLPDAASEPAAAEAAPAAHARQPEAEATMQQQPVAAPARPTRTLTQPEAAPRGVTTADAGAPAQNLALMVQIAAVTQAADAETLSRALRHDGYDAVIRTTDGDKYFHVQVGPFASMETARTMKSRLAASGYSAFIRR